MRILLALSALLLTSAAAHASCRDEVGAAKAKVYVRHCGDVSPATRPPCNAENACALILAEIRRGCAFLKDEAPAIVGNTRDGADAGKGRSPDARSDIRGPLSPARPTRMSLTLHWPTETFAGEGGLAYG